MADIFDAVCEWDYNCPQYVDFTEPIPLDDDADKWFDEDCGDFEDTENENMKNAEVKQEPHSRKTPKALAPKTPKTATPKAEVAPMTIEESSGPVTRHQANVNGTHSNLCTSLDEWNKKKKQLSDGGKKVGVVTPLRSGKPVLKKQGISASSLQICGSQDEVAETKKRPLKRSNSTVNSASAEILRARQDECADMKKWSSKRSNSTANSASAMRVSIGQDEGADTKKRPLKRSNSTANSASAVRVSTGQDEGADTKKRPLKRSNSTANSASAERVSGGHTRGFSAGRFRAHESGTNSEHEPPSAKIRKMYAIPTTPTFMRRKQLAAGSPKMKTTEEQELEQIAHMRKELAKKRKIAQESLMKSKVAPGYVPLHATKDPTKPQDFKFSTDSRIKTKSQDAQEECLADFTRSLRSQTTTSQALKAQPFNLTLTKPQPFNLSSGHTKSSQAQSEKYQSMAQSIAAFHRATPDRFRRKPRTTSADRKLHKARSPRLTNPETPKLEARNRHRAPFLPSQKDIDDKEYEEMKRHQFKANPLNAKIFSQTIGLHKPEPKPPTEPEGFSLHLERRFKERPTHKTDEDKFVFHAQPVNKKILEGTVGVKPPKEIPATVPQSPAFALKNRVRLPVEIPQEKEAEKHIPKAHAVPHPGVPFQPKRPHKMTTPEPFSFVNRYPDPNSVKEAKRRQQLEEEQKKREFKANPLPNLEPVLPEKHTRIATKPEPFNLQCDIRGARKTEEWEHKVLEEEQASQKKAAEFKARAAEVLNMDPFVPQKSTRPLTDRNAIILNTERRAVDRDDFELRKKARQAHLAEMNHERELQKEEEEKAAIAKLRAEMVHKSNPVKKYRGVQVQVSEKLPTMPESPRFSERLRSKVRV